MSLSLSFLNCKGAMTVRVSALQSRPKDLISAFDQEITTHSWHNKTHSQDMNKSTRFGARLPGFQSWLHLSQAVNTGKLLHFSVENAQTTAHPPPLASLRENEMNVLKASRIASGR